MPQSTLPRAPWARPERRREDDRRERRGRGRLRVVGEQADEQGHHDEPAPTPKRAEKRPAASPPRGEGGRENPMLASAAVTVSDGSAAALEPLRAQPSDSAVLCDVDGTLAPIVARYEDARLLDGAHERPAATARPGAPAGLRQRPRAGRPRADGRARRMRLRGQPRHGAPPPGRAAPARARGGRAPGRRSRAFAARWPPERLAEGGLRMEPKGATISVHAPGGADPGGGACCSGGRPPRRAEHGLVPHGRPRGAGGAPARGGGQGHRGARPAARSGARRRMYIGDDRTDADAWRALRALRERRGARPRRWASRWRAREVPPDGARGGRRRRSPGPPGALAALRHLARY